MATATNPIVQRIRELLEERREKNPSYSLRALARQLGIPAATLSRILSDKRGMSVSMARRIVNRLTDHPAERRRLLQAFALEPKTVPAKPTRYRKLSARELEMMSSWGHSAVLEVLRVEGSEGTRSLERLSVATGLSEKEVQQCLKDLRVLGFVQHSIKRGWSTKELHLSSMALEGIAAWRRIQRGYVERALRFLDDYRLEQGAVRGITLVVPPERIDEAKAKIQEFAEELSDELSRDGGEVLYRLNFQLFPLGRNWRAPRG
jgi:uncharacterized protein (TIGR02147 family)